MPQKFKVLRDRTLGSQTMATKGDVVYEAMKYDYGLARDDSEILGVLHISVTLKEDGDYPTFTIPMHDLENIS